MPRTCILLLITLTAPLRAAEQPSFNYAEALQKSLYFYEAQQSGALSPNNRVAWRGPVLHGRRQGHRRDLSGGWYDAGDHWTANLTMASPAMPRWSAVDAPDGYLESEPDGRAARGARPRRTATSSSACSPRRKDPAARCAW
jgi:hypothetical protein